MLLSPKPSMSMADWPDGGVTAEALPADVLLEMAATCSRHAGVVEENFQKFRKRKCSKMNGNPASRYLP